MQTLRVARQPKSQDPSSQTALLDSQRARHEHGQNGKPFRGRSKLELVDLKNWQREDGNVQGSMDHHGAELEFRVVDGAYGIFYRQIPERLYGDAMQQIQKGLPEDLSALIPRLFLSNRAG